MEDFFFFLAVIILLIFFIQICADVRKPKGYPPGPRWWPIVGCFPYVKKLHLQNKYFHLAVEALHEMYGPVVGLKLGFDKVVLISGFQLVREVGLSELCDGRPEGLFYRLRSFGDRLGVVFVDGHFQQVQKKFTMNLLRKLGFGSHPMHNIMVKEAQELTKIIEEKCERPIQINQLLDLHTLNVIWTLLAGYRFSADDKRLMKLLRLVHEAFKISEMSGGAINQMPFLRYVAPNWTGYTVLKTFANKMLNFLQEIVQNHNPTDDQNFISIYLEKIKEDAKIENTTFTRKQLLVLLLDLFMAGTETTSSTLVFALYYLIQHPEVQKKVHEELDRELGSDEMPTLEHRDRLIYLEATIMEAQRMCSLAPLTIPHKALGEIELMGYKIPKKTTLLPSIWSVHMDKNYWKDPNTFRPERFIDENGQIIQTGHFLPFGVGRRKCLGEILAKGTLFVFLAVILKKFELKLAVDDQFVDVIDGLTLSLSPFEIKFIRRHSPTIM